MATNETQGRSESVVFNTVPSSIIHIIYIYNFYIPSLHLEPLRRTFSAKDKENKDSSCGSHFAEPSSKQF